MEPALFENFEADESLPVFTPERPDLEMVYFALRCPCGAERFRLAGWPCAVSGPGGFFWRSVARVWREVLLSVGEEDGLSSPFWLPLSTCCDGCGRDEKLFDEDHVAGRLAANERARPRESIRCRICRRGLFELVVGVARDSAQNERVDFPSEVEVLLRCHTCHRQARVARSESQGSEQEIQLDLLYGRR